MTVATAICLKHFKNATVLKHFLEVVERLVIAEVDLTHNVFDPLAFHVEGIVFAANDSLTLAADNNVFGSVFFFVNLNGGQFLKACRYAANECLYALTGDRRDAKELPATIICGRSANSGL